MVVDLSTSSTNPCLPQQVVRIRTQNVLADPAMSLVCACVYVWANSTFHRSLQQTPRRPFTLHTPTRDRV